MGMLILSLGITIALVGALFYYVRQRLEVLEVSHKEQIGVMQNFIASIGDQFHRMHSFIRMQFSGGEKEMPVGGDGENASVMNAPTMTPPPFAHNSSLIDVSSSDDSDDDSNSDYDDDSATSDTDAADYGGSIRIYDDIYINGARARSFTGGAHEVVDEDSEDEDNASDAGLPRHCNHRASDIKIIELSSDSRNRTVSNDGSDTDIDTDTDADTDTDTATETDADDDNKSINVTVIKSDSAYCEILGESVQHDDSQPAEATGAVASRSMIIDLDLGDFDADIRPISNSPNVDAQDACRSGDTPSEPYHELELEPKPESEPEPEPSSGENHKIKGGGASHAQMSIKQLRKLVKFHNIDIHNQDISKLKREQLSDILAAANVKT
jgi:hypothetical protein